MKNFGNSISKFLSNKNTVTLFGLIAIVAVLYVGYNYRVNQAVNPIQVPYALETIQPRTKITNAMVGSMAVPPAYLTNNVIRDSRFIIDNYSNYNTLIPAGSLFFKETVISINELPDAPFYNIPKGMVAYNMSVNMQVSYANSIFPGNYIDIYFKSVDDDGKIIFGKLVGNVEMLAVKDSNGRNVFESTADGRTPTVFIFAVQEQIHLLLRKASYMYDAGAELIPVPISETYKPAEMGTELKSDYLKEFINTRSVFVPENVIEEEVKKETKDKKEETIFNQ